MGIWRVVSRNSRSASGETRNWAKAHASWGCSVDEKRAMFLVSPYVTGAPAKPSGTGIGAKSNRMSGAFSISQPAVHGPVNSVATRRCAKALPCNVESGKWPSR